MFTSLLSIIYTSLVKIEDGYICYCAFFLCIAFANPPPVCQTDLKGISISEGKLPQTFKVKDFVNLSVLTYVE